MGIQLIMQRADGSERAFPVLKSRFVIGRGPRCDLRVAVPAVSPEHCEINLLDNEIRLANLNEAQTTLLNGNKIDQARIQPDDIVTIGPVTFRIREIPSPGSGTGSGDGVSKDGASGGVHITRLSPPAIGEAQA